MFTCEFWCFHYPPPRNSDVPKAAFRLGDGQHLATVALMRVMGVMIPNTLMGPEYQNEQLYAGKWDRI